jgi:hypothetical protein
MSSPATTIDRPSYHLVVIGAVLPAIFTILNARLQAERSVLPFMAALVLEVGMLGILCGKLVRPLWLACVIYGWSWLVMDIPVLALALQDQWPWVLISGDTLPAALLSGQLGLVIVWLVLGQARWSTRWPAALVLATAAFVPLIWHRIRPTEFLIMLGLQTTLFACACGAIRLFGFRLVRGASNEIDQVIGERRPVRLVRESQFLVRDILFWMTALALALAAARAAGYWPALVEAWHQALNGIQSSGIWAMFLPAPRTAILSTAILVIAMWTALSPTAAWRSWSIFVVCAVAIAFGSALLDFRTPMGTWFQRLSPWDPQFWRYFWHFQWSQMAWLILSGAMLLAALLFPRTLGYRLTRQNPPAFRST